MLITNNLTSYPNSSVAPSSNTRLSMKVVAICGTSLTPRSCKGKRSIKRTTLHLCSSLDSGLTSFITSSSPRIVQPKERKVKTFSNRRKKSLLHDSCTPYSPITQMKHD
ncbi:hypothetical protein ACB098_07G149000 [Castanea mollissima]